MKFADFRSAAGAWYLKRDPCAPLSKLKQENIQHWIAAMNR
jgi:hypothetical protein